MLQLIFECGLGLFQLSNPQLCRWFVTEIGRINPAARAAGLADIGDVALALDDLEPVSLLWWMPTSSLSMT